MDARMFTSGSVKRFQYLLLGAIFFFFTAQLALAAPVVVSVDHRVIVSYSKPQFDARKGFLTTQVRVKNRSGAALLSPLQLSFDQTTLKNLHIQNAQGIGKDGRPYFDIKLPKGMLLAKASTDAIKVVIAVERKDKDVKPGNIKTVLAALNRAQHVSAGVEVAPLEPRAEPYALKVGSGKVSVRFSAKLVGGTKGQPKVYLRRSGERKAFAMNDLGKDGDPVAKDGVHSVSILVDATKLKPDACLIYESFIKQGKEEVASSPFKLCVSAFPIRVAASNAAHLVEFSDGSKAIADEVVVTVNKSTNTASIQRLATDVDAIVVGSIPSLGLYQLKLPAPVNANRLLELVGKLQLHPEVKVATVNAVGGYAFSPNDPEYVSQHGLQLIRAQDVWDIGANGNGVIVTLLDNGLDRTHPDFGLATTDPAYTSPADCQLVENDCIVGVNNDTGPKAGHGTQVAGVVAAKTNNNSGVAGVAYGSKIHSIRVDLTVDIANPLLTFTRIANGFDDAASYTASHGAAAIINASFSFPSSGANWDPVCTAINNAVLDGPMDPVTGLNTGNARAIVVNAVGNSGSNGYYYPARCNDFNPKLTRKDLFITVANSVSSTTIDPACANATLVDQRCGGTTTGVNNTSNYGAWVDISAPGMSIRTTNAGGGYITQTGTSFSAPMVAGAAAILKQCGVPLGDDLTTPMVTEGIEYALKTSGNNVHVAYPPGGINDWVPRLDIYRALSSVNRAPTGVALSLISPIENTNTGAGVNVGALTAVDLDTCDKHTFSIVPGADAVSFSINTATSPNTLILSDGVLNYEAKPSYQAIVRVTDFFGATVDQLVTVDVTNENEAPTAINLSASSIDENNTAGATVATLTATDPDTIASGYASPFTFELVTGVGDTGNGAFTITGNTLTINNVADFEATPNYSIRIRVTDNGGLSYETTKTVAINNRNEAPTAINLSASSIDENNAAGATVATLTATDPDTIASGYASPFTFELVTGVGDTGNGAFTITGNTLTINNVADFEATPNYSIRIRVTDNGGQSYETTKTVSINNLNDAPSIVGPLSFTHPEYNQVNPAASPVFDDYVGDVGASDPEGDALTFIITAGNEAIVNGSTQSNAFRFDAAIPGRLLVDNRLAVNFEYKPVFNLAVKVTDAGGLSASDNVTVTLSNDANDNGDPHITTVRGLRYDFQSAGEFIALRGANGMEIQTRQTAIPGPAPFADPYSGLAVGVSINTAVAARVGGNRVTYQPNADGVPELRINGNVTTLPANGVDLGVGGRVIPLGANSIQVDFPDGTVMTVSAYLWGSLSYMQIGVMHTPAREGLMGINTAGSWLPRLADGTSFGAMPSALCDRFVELYEKFANSWRVTDDNSLFDYAPGTSTSTFTSVWPLEKPICAAPSIAATPRSAAAAVAASERRIAPVAPKGIVLKPVAKEVAQQQCRAIAGKTEKANCIFDVMFTGNTGFARAYQRTEKLRAGLTSVVLRVADKLNAQGEMVVVATVARHSTVVPNVKGVRAVPAGAVQFMLGDKPLGKPVKLDAKGQAKLVMTRQNMVRLNADKLEISAQYQPTRDKANVFLPSISRKLTRELMPTGPVVRGDDFPRRLK